MTAAMREGRRRPSLPAPPPAPAHRSIAAMREGRRRPSLLLPGLCWYSLSTRRNEGWAPAPLVGVPLPTVRDTQTGPQ